MCFFWVLLRSGPVRDVDRPMVIPSSEGLDLRVETWDEKDVVQLISLPDAVVHCKPMKGWHCSFICSSQPKSTPFLKYAAKGLHTTGLETHYDNSRRSSNPNIFCCPRCRRVGEAKTDGNALVGFLDTPKHNSFPFSRASENFRVILPTVYEEREAVEIWYLSLASASRSSRSSSPWTF
jgi:hypothetical protein